MICAGTIKNGFQNVHPIPGAGIIDGLTLGVTYYFQLGIASGGGGTTTIDPGEPFGTGIDPVAVVIEL